MPFRALFLCIDALCFFNLSAGEQTKKRQPPKRKAAVILITNKIYQPHMMP